jgi:hypothetical protein
MTVILLSVILQSVILLSIILLDVILLNAIALHSLLHCYKTPYKHYYVYLLPMYKEPKMVF